MLISFSSNEPESYNSYKKRKFKKYEDKINNLLHGINDMSLKGKDKLISKIKDKVNNFKRR